jgi:hypothetical protein
MNQKRARRSDERLGDDQRLEIITWIKTAIQAREFHVDEKVIRMLKANMSQRNQCRYGDETNCISSFAAKMANIGNLTSIKFNF